MALAIALGHEPPHHDDPPEGPDSFLADHGFEYIDGERTRYPEKIASASEENGEDNVDEDDVQGLSRVVDALSTIMWPTMVRKQANNIIGGRVENRLRPSLFDFNDDDDHILLGGDDDDDDEEATLAALMEADAVDQGAPQTRASRVRSEMQALERWLVENEELHERELSGADGVTDDDDGDDDRDGDEDHDEDRDHEHDAPLPSVQASSSSPAVPGVRAAPVVDDPWAASTTSNPTSTSTQTQTQTQSTALASHSISITTPRSSGFDDDFSAFVSAPAVSITGDTAATAKTTPASTTASASEPIADMTRRLYTQTQLLLPSHTGGSIRSIRSAMSDLSIGDDLGVDGGYEALDDISNGSLNFSPEHGRDVDIDDGDPCSSIRGQRSGDLPASLGDVPFDLPDILTALQTVREDVAGISDEAERRATTARFASEFVYKRMGVDDRDGDEKETEV